MTGYREQHVKRFLILLLGIFWLGFPVAAPAALTVTISGRVTQLVNFVPRGVPGVTVAVQGTTNSTVTNPFGGYSLQVNLGFDGTVVASATCMNFSPASRTYQNLISDQTDQDFSGVLKTVTIAGRVIEDVPGMPLPVGQAGVAMNGLPGTPVTDATGNYSGTVSCSWDGTVTPSKAGLQFSPASKTYSNVTTNQSSENYNASSPKITGTVRTASGEGVNLFLSPSPLIRWYSSNSVSGEYTVAVPFGGSGTLAPNTAFCHTFNPPSRTYSNVAGDIPNQNYTATPYKFTISGHITDSDPMYGQPLGLAGVTMSGLPGNPLTDANGNYSASVDCGWSGTVTPSKAGFSFTPPFKTYTSVSTNRPGQDYASFQPRITGTVRTAGGEPALMLLGIDISGFGRWYSTNVVTGEYYFVATFGGSGTVAPKTSQCYPSYVPPSRAYSNLTSHQTDQDFTATLGRPPTISGNAGAPGVTMTGLPGNPVTDANGNYSVTVNCGWNGAVTPVKPGHTFSPVAPSTGFMFEDKVQNFTATVQTLTISGLVRTAGLQAISGVAMNGLPGNPVTDAGGNYTATVESGWSGTVTPTKTGYTFTPPSTSYSNVAGSQTQNYTGTAVAQTFTISGLVRTAGLQGIAGVAMNGLPGSPVTDAGGNYTATVESGWSGTVTPSKASYTFSPPSTSYSGVSGDQIQNYTGTAVAQTFTISGLVRTAGLQAIAGVAMNGLPGNPVTDGGGNYTATVESGWSGTVTLSKAGYTFSPPSTSYSNVASSQIQNYTGTVALPPAFTAVSAASFLGDAPLTAASIASGFGQGLSAGTEIAPSTPPLPTSLAGTSVKVRDSSGAERLAPLWFVSPGQINFYVPEGTRTGPATVTVETPAGPVATGATLIETVSPAFFSMNANGQGVAAAIAVRVKADLSQSWEYVFEAGCTVGSCVPKPIDLGPETEQVYLQLYGTGIRGVASSGPASATIGGVNVAVVFAGPAAGYIGLDQVNLLVPRSLMGRGEVGINMTAGGKTSNTVTVNIR